MVYAIDVHLGQWVIGFGTGSSQGRRSGGNICCTSSPTALESFENFYFLLQFTRDWVGICAPKKILFNILITRSKLGSWASVVLGLNPTESKINAFSSAASEPPNRMQLAFWRHFSLRGCGHMNCLIVMTNMRNDEHSPLWTEISGLSFPAKAART